MTKGKQGDSGEAKRNAYTIKKEGGYRALMVNLGKLLNKMVLPAYRDGSLVYKRGVDSHAVELQRKGTTLN